MDALLDLFDEEQLCQANNDVTEHLLTNVVVSNESDDDEDDADGTSSERNTVSPESVNTNRPTKKKHHTTNDVSISVDDRLGIRMKNRLICGIDLMNMICESNFYTPAQLSSMSVQALNNRVLCDPASIVDIATVTGRTNILIIGLVFTNTGSRISSSGTAFCILEIGSTIQTGPTVSILLFGTAFSTYCQSIKSGHIIAIVQPRLLPKKQKDNSSRGGNVDYTSISFTINDTSNLKIVAEARDMALCKGKVSSKDITTGRWTSNSKRCCHYVDTRINEYCQQHYNQKNQNTITTQIQNGMSGQTPINNHNKNKMQQLLADAAEYKNMTNIKQSQRVSVPPTNDIRNSSNNNNTVNTTNSLLNPKPSLSQQKTLSRMQYTTTTATHTANKFQTNNMQQSNSNGNKINQDNKLLNVRQPDHHPTANNTTDENQTNNVHSSNKNSLHQKNSLLNPTHSNRQNSVPTKPITNTASASNCNPVRNNNGSSFLDCRTKRNRPIEMNPFDTYTANKEATSKYTSTNNNKNNNNTHKRKINTDTDGFNGTVAVPKAGRILSGKMMPSTSKHHIGNTRAADVHEKKLDQVCEIRQREVVDRQRLIADQMKLGTSFVEAGTSTVRSKIVKTKTVGNSNNIDTIRSAGKRILQKEDLLFAPLGDIDLEKIVNTKSRYHDQVNAEEHAKSRRVMLTLEAEEEKKNYNEEKKKKNSGEKANDGTSSSCKEKNDMIQKQYVCKTCQHTYQYYPTKCYSNNHSISINRSIKEIKSIAETRQAITDKKIEDGGITIATGLEWNKWKS